MESLKFFRIFFFYCLIAQIFAAPVPASSPDFCTGKQLLNFESGKEYTYDYETDSTLWINDVSDQAKSSIKLKTVVKIKSIQPCTYLLSLEESSLTGDSVDSDQSVLDQLNNFDAVFRINPQGELDSNVQFQSGDKQWSRNIKRAVISAFQVESEDNLRSLDALSDPNEKSAVVYETDILGRCRTTYTLNKNGYEADKSLTLNKKKSLQRCTLNNNRKITAVQFVPYKVAPEFYQGRLFAENYECTSVVQNNLVNNVECKEVSTYKIGSRGPYGAQAIVKQSLKLKGSSSSSAAAPNTDSFENKSIMFEFEEKNERELELKNFSIEKFTTDICENVEANGLDMEHSSNFRDLVITIRDYSTADLIKLFDDSNKKCELAGSTIAQSFLFSDDDNAFEAVLSLMDKDAYSNQKYITEYPVLSALARNSNPSLDLVNKMKDYLSKKSNDFPYLNKLNLVYSALVRSYWSDNKKTCDQNQLNELSSIFEKNLGDDCSDASKQDLIISSLKAIGNIGSFKNVNVLEKCADKKENSVEIRVNAIQAFRNFECSATETLNENYDLLQDANEDAEIRITAFESIMRCSDNSEKFKNFANSKLADFLLKENDVQVLTYIIDYGKEHKLTSIMNAVLSDARIKEKFSVNFKEVSWNNYKYSYNVLRDGAVELDTSVIYTSKTFIPRRVRFNATVHLHGMSVNFADATLRFEGLDHILKAILIDKLTSEKLLKRVMEQPEQLLDILKIVSEKLKYVPEKAQMSLSFRVYGSDVFYSKLDSAEEFKRLANYLKNPRETALYRQTKTIRNIFLFETTVKQPLLNGFEFETHFDGSLGLFISKGSTKTKVDSDLEFDLNNFLSASVTTNRKFEVQLNHKNRLAIKKRTVRNLRVKMDIDGFKKEVNGGKQAVYNLNLVPVENLPLYRSTGKYFKLVKNSNYQEITEFKIPRYESKNCTSDKFSNAFGVELCYSVSRPKVSLKELIKPFNVEEAFDSYTDDENDEEFEHNDTDDKLEEHERPKLILTGPYNYEFVLKNPKKIKTIIFDANFLKTQDKTDFLGHVSVKDSSNEVKKTLELTYSRQKQRTNRALDAKVNLELKVPLTNEVRLKVLGEIFYIKNELIGSNWSIDNKILREFSNTFNFKRSKTEGNVIPHYHYEAILDSKIREPKHYRALIDIKPDGKNVRSDIIVEKSNAATNNQILKIVDAILTMNADTDENGNVDYAVDFHSETNIRNRKAEFNVYGHVLVGLLKSNVDLSVKYSNPTFSLPKPGQIKFGHFYDGSADAKSYAEFHLDVPNTPINHGLKTVFNFDFETKSLNYLEFLVSRPSAEKPLSLFYEKSVRVVDQITTADYSLGVRNAQYDLSRSESSLSSSLQNVDEDSVLKSLVAHYSRLHDKANKKINFEVEIKKNDNPFVKISLNAFGNLQAFKSQEIPKQSFGAELFIKAMENSGSISAKLDSEYSKANNVNNQEFNFKTENLFKMLLRIESVNFKVESANGNFNTVYELVRVGDVKSIKLVSKGPLRTNGDSKEFDVDYEKTLANGDVLKGSGVVTSKINGPSNFESSISIPSHYSSKLSVKHDTALKVEFGNTHLDHEPTERKLSLFVDKEDDDLTLKINARRGEPNSLDNNEKLDTLIDLKYKRSSVKLENGKNKLTHLESDLLLKSKRFNVDLDSDISYDYDMKNKMVKGNFKNNAKYPAIFSDPGSLNNLKENIEYTRNLANNDIDLDLDFETDSKLFSFIRVLKLDMSKKTLPSAVEVRNLDVNYKLASDDADAKLKNFKLNYERQSEPKNKYAKINLKQEILPEIESLFKSGVLVSIKDCTIFSSIKIQKTDTLSSYDDLFDIICDAKKLTTNVIKFDKTYKPNDETVSNFFTLTDSDLYYTKKTISITREKFNKKNGLLKVSLKNVDAYEFSNEFSYKRQVNEETNKLENANYHLSTQFGPGLSKVCDLNIESKTDYFNTLSCKLITTKVPGVELNYGYNLKVDNPKDYFFGKRGFQFDFIVPGRTIRTVYKANYNVDVNASDDNDDDENDSREFNSTLAFSWNLIKDPKKTLTINFKRDIQEKGRRVFLAEIVDSPHFKFLRFKTDRELSFNESSLKASLAYELKNGNKNQLDYNLKLSSDMHENSFSVETNLQNPSVNTLYENRYEKHTGKLQYLGFRIGKVLKLAIDKESDPEHRHISIEFVQPDSKYTYVAKQQHNGDVYVVDGTLSKNGNQLSTIKSSFDAEHNQFEVTLKGAKTYKFNFGVFNESLANAVALEVDSNKVLGLASMSILGHDSHNDLKVSLRWNRLWNSIKKDILGGSDASSTQESDKFNSYLGDSYAVLSGDFKPIIEENRKERKECVNDIRNFALILLDFYSNAKNFLRALPSRFNVKGGNQSRLQALIQSQMLPEPEEKEEVPLYKRVLKRYNDIAMKLNSLHLKVRKFSKRLSKYVPRLPTYEYNKEQLNRMKQPFDNNLVISRPTLYANNLYQFNAEYRDYVRKFGDNLAMIKKTALRNTGGMNLRALVNKYKFRSFKDYTLVASVYKRNVVGFDGESLTLQSKCKYLLAHETSKNEFSVILDLNNANFPITVAAHGQQVNFGSNKAAINNQQTDLPKNFDLGDHGRLSVTKTGNGVCVELNHDMKTCCYEDSNSCTVALTRWFTGKVTGLLGKADNDQDTIKESDWYLDGSCSFPNNVLKKPTEEAARMCYSMFGRHRRAIFRNAIQAIKPEGWQKVCERALTADIKSKCAIMRAFVHHANEESVTIDVPNDCYSCKLNDKTYPIGKSVSKDQKVTAEKGSDYVFLMLPCDKNKYPLDLSKVDFKSSANDKYYIVEVDEHEASIYQSESGEISNFDLKNAQKALASDKTVTKINKEIFNEALFLAASLFSQRVAENRILVIRSCGNCIPYSAFATLKYARKITERNVVVHSWGDYEIKDKGDENTENKPIGYDHHNVYTFKSSDKSFDSDMVESYKLEHNVDLCSRLAVKTHGQVINVNYLGEANVASNVAKMLKEPKDTFSYRINSCNKLDTKYGDLTDFSYTRIKTDNDD